MEKPSVVFENENFLVLNKPAGWVVNSADTVKTSYIIQKWLKGKFKYPISNNDLYRCGVVHRIDKETSGLLIVAKTEGIFANMQKLFKERKIIKEYITLVHGRVLAKKGRIDVPVGRLPWNRKRFGVLSEGKLATTDYQVDSYYINTISEEVYSLITVKPKTGRTHQIRVHFKYINHPIVSDAFYAGRKTSREDRKWCPRLFLHASKLEFELDKKYTFTSDLPADLTSSLSFLKKV